MVDDNSNIPEWSKHISSPDDFQSRLIVVTPFRNAVRNLERYFDQLVQLRECVKPYDLGLYLIALEGDSVDGTRDKLHQYMDKLNIEGCIDNVSHGGLAWKSVEDQARLEAMSMIMNIGMQDVRNIALPNDVVMWIMSDLKYDPQEIIRLIGHSLSFLDEIVFTPMAMIDAMPDMFYDTWAYRINGKRFNNNVPYHSDIRYDEPFTGVDSAGTCLVFSASILLSNPSIKSDKEEAVSFCNSARDAGIQILLDRSVKVYHGDTPRKKMLFVGEVLVTSGFSRISHMVLPALAEHYDIDILGIGYSGAPHNLPYRVYPANLIPGSGYCGEKTLQQLVYFNNYDLVLMLGDVYNIENLVGHILEVKESQGEDFKLPKLIGWLAVDSLNQRIGSLEHLDLMLVWTEFGRQEMVKTGYPEDQIMISPLGVDTSVFYPDRDNRSGHRKELFGENITDSDLVLLYVGVNQQRKRLELLLQALAYLVQRDNITNLRLHLVVKFKGLDLDNLIRFYQLERYVSIDLNRKSDEQLRELYNASDFFVNVAQAEGWCLPALESLACGIPVIYPSESAIESWMSQETRQQSLMAIKVTDDLISNSPLENSCHTLGRIIDRVDLEGNLINILESSSGYYQKTTDDPIYFTKELCQKSLIENLKSLED